MGGVDTERRNIALQHDDDQHDHHHHHHHHPHYHHHLHHHQHHHHHHRHLYFNSETQEVLRIHGLGFLEADRNAEYWDLCDLLGLSYSPKP